MNKYIVVSNEKYYPWVEEFKTLKEAKEYYDKTSEYHCKIFLAKIMKFKEIKYE